MGLSEKYELFILLSHSFNIFPKSCRVWGGTQVENDWRLGPGKQSRVSEDVRGYLDAQCSNPVPEDISRCRILPRKRGAVCTPQ